MGEKQYTLDDLVDRTGFSKRQIRYYITEKLIPGAGNQRGPNAVYSEKTLQRLEMIKALKAQPMGPTGRVMTLAEIRHAMDNQNQQDFFPKAQKISYCQTEALVVSEDTLQSSASNYLAKLEDAGPSYGESERDQPLESLSCFMREISSADNIPEAPSPIDDVLQYFHSLLMELGSDTQYDNQDGERNSWRRITFPDVEIQVRTPDNLEARLRLNQMAGKLGHLLERENDDVQHE